ncbi:MAG: hypothetical protein HYY54_01390 [candidate division NC10 bacterium]|nr:hypothetical protein [candidate division NC10 bacterium]MBI4390630.1 hypothetical protein [candidate division NC10 bacterium]
MTEPFEFEEELPLVSVEEAVAEVRRWLDVERVDPEQVFAMADARMIYYKDLIPLLEAGGEESRLIRFAISRGRAIRQTRGAPGMLEITPRERPGGE